MNNSKLTIWTKSYAKALGERVISTLLQVLIGFGTAFAQNGFTFDGWDWKNTLIAITVSTVVATAKGLLTNLVTKDGPGLTHAEQVTPSLPNQPES